MEISSPTAGISCGVLQSISGCLLQHYELITSMLKVQIYVTAKSVLVFAFRTRSELPDAGWPWAAESILPSAGAAPGSGDSAFHTSGFTQGSKGDLCLCLTLGRRNFLL